MFDDGGSKKSPPPLLPPPTAVAAAAAAALAAALAAAIVHASLEAASSSGSHLLKWGPSVATRLASCASINSWSGSSSAAPRSVCSSAGMTVGRQGTAPPRSEPST